MSFVANKQNPAQLTNIHYWDSAAGAWSGNLVGAAPPFILLPNPVVVGDLVLFGIDSAILNTGPFCSLVFDLLAAITGITTILWKYSQAASVDPTAWVPFVAIQDNTNAAGALTGVAFDTTGIHSVHWRQPSAWVVQNPAVGVGPALGVTAYWVSAEVTAGGPGTPPIQQNRSIYTVTWAHAETEEVGGDMDALVDAELLNVRSGGVGGIDHIYMGSRLTSRSANFLPFLPLGGTQLPAGWTVIPAVDGIMTADMETATGSVSHTVWPVPNAWRIMATGYMDTDFLRSYRGTFRIFVRMRMVGGATGDVQIRGYFDPMSIPYYTQAGVPVPETFMQYDIVDLGTMTFPIQQLLETEDEYRSYFTLHARNDGGSTAASFSELIFLPVDENAIEVRSDLPWSQWSRNDGQELHLDSLRLPKVQTRTLTYRPATGHVVGYMDHTGGRIIMRPNDIQRHYFITRDNSNAVSYCDECFEVTDWVATQRYSSMRGAR